VVVRVEAQTHRREALRLADSFVGTERVLLRLVCNHDRSVSAILAAFDLEPDKVRRAFAEGTSS
jgi:hypothetical protein